MANILSKQILRQKLSRIDGRDYGRYQSLTGEYDFDPFRLIIQQIPKDPFAPPHTGIYRIQVQRNDSRIVQFTTDSEIQKIACGDFLTRLFYDTGRRISGGTRGTGFSGTITINQPGHAVLERNCVIISDDMIELRCFLGLPADGRKINSKIAEHMFFNELVEIVEQSLLNENIDHKALKKHVEVAQDSEYLRDRLQSDGLIAFIADQASLPRESGTSDKPMSGKAVIPFSSPDRLKVEMDLPNAGRISGMGIPAGVTLITGGGYHGKSTLLNALEVGIYNHIPGDGRGYCVSNAQTAKVRAYSGRSVVKTDISPFIKNLPYQKNTTSFCTENASGSTSQAASIIEAIEAGAKVLLMDEDTCAANFMSRDSKMQQLVSKENEPITAFIDRVQQIYQEKMISTVLVLGSVGDYFDVSDLVIRMTDYQPHDVTSKAHGIAERSPAKRTVEDKSCPFTVRERCPEPASFDPANRYGKFSINAREINRLNFGKQTIDLTDVEQLIELSQTKAIGFAMEYAKKHIDKETPLSEVVRRVITDIDENGLDVLSKKMSGHFARFRGLELAFAINRMRGLNVLQMDRKHIY